jgi:O-methyltransferase domain
MAPSGRVAIVEMPVVEGGPGRMTALLDLNMLLMLPGKERTTEEYAALLDRAGLRMTGVTPTQSGIALIEGRAK